MKNLKNKNIDTQFKNINKGNWFEHLSLHYKLLYYYICGILTGLLLHYLWVV